MLLPLLVMSGAVLFGAAAYADKHEGRQSPVVLDENLWVTFYDLPSRRFRAIRAAVLLRDIEAAARDLSVTANYLTVEADRASAVFQGPLRVVVERLREMTKSADELTLEELDTLFGRAHWLLAQHYLESARQARDVRQARNTSLYLLATTHHLERAMLWSNVPVTREVHRTLEGLQDVAGELQSPETSSRAFRDKPVVRAENLLRKIGEQMDRRVLLAPVVRDE